MAATHIDQDAARTARQSFVVGFDLRCAWWATKDGQQRNRSERLGTAFTYNFSEREDSCGLGMAVSDEAAAVTGMSHTHNTEVKQFWIGEAGRDINPHRSTPLHSNPCAHLLKDGCECCFERPADDTGPSAGIAGDTHFAPRHASYDGL